MDRQKGAGAAELGGLLERNTQNGAAANPRRGQEPQDSTPELRVGYVHILRQRSFPFGNDLLRLGIVLSPRIYGGSYHKKEGLTTRTVRSHFEF